MKFIGKSVEKIDGMAITTGEAVYTDDQCTESYLYVHIVRSPHAFAKIESINVDKALSFRGVESVLTYHDVPNVRFTVAGQSYPEPSPYDRKILDEYVRYVGDPVAIIAADSEATAKKAEKLLRIDYDVLTPVLDPKEAEMSDSKVHPESDLSVHFDFGCDPSKNLAGTYEVGYGKMDEAFESCDVIVENEYSSQAQAHAMMETYRSLSYLDAEGKLTIVSATQIPFHVRRIAAQALEMKEENIRVLKPRIGGGFGGKQTIATELIGALVTMKTGKPARVVYNRKETFSTSSSRHAMHVNIKIGATTEGIIKAIDMQALSDTGAYGEHGWTVLMVAGHKSLPLYNQAVAARYRGKVVYTNKMPAGALRGYGVTQAIFAMESALNELADKLGIDPAELRLKNIIREGDHNPILEGSNEDAAAMLQSCTLNRCIEKGRELIGWNEKFPRQEMGGSKVRGVGMAITMQGSGIAEIDSATAEIVKNSDKSYTLKIGATDMGTGCDTILLQMAADALEVPLNQIEVVTGDTDNMPYDTGSYASSTTYVTGNAVLRAVKDLKMKLKEDVLLPVMGSGTFSGNTSPPPFIAGFAEVEVDTLTGQIALLNYVAAVDCGTVINTNLARIQVEGGLVQGIGMALYEDVQYTSKGRMMTDTFMQYKVPTRRDINDLQIEFVPSYEPTGPAGAKSIGEVVINTPPPAIAHAIANATGVHLRSLPIKPEDLCMAIRHNNAQNNSRVTLIPDLIHEIRMS